MAFASYRRAPGDTTAKPYASLWYVDRVGEQWGPPVFIAAATALGSYHSQVLFGPDGRLFFRRTTPPRWAVQQTFATAWDTSGYGPPVEAPEIARWQEVNPALYVAGGRPGSDSTFFILEVSGRDLSTKKIRGPAGLWVTFRRGTTWTTPRPLGADVNADKQVNIFPFFSPDGCELLFVRDFSTFYHVALSAAFGRN
jgi:hypothetical protein